MRLLNRPLAFILAVALGVAAVLVIVEVITAAVSHPPLVLSWTTWYRWADRTHWNQLVIEFWSSVLIAVGVVILAIELKPTRVSRMRIRALDDATDAAVTRRGLAGVLGTTATGVDGISSAVVSIHRLRVRVTATAAARGRTAADALEQPLTQALQGSLDELELRHPPHLTVRVNTRSR